MKKTEVLKVKSVRKIVNYDLTKTYMHDSLNSNLNIRENIIWIILAFQESIDLNECSTRKQNWMEPNDAIAFLLRGDAGRKIAVFWEILTFLYLAALAFLNT